MLAILNTEPDKPLNQKTFQLTDESIKIGSPEHCVESVQETNIVKKDKSTPIHFTTNDNTEISENQIPASVKPNKIEPSVVELCQTRGKFDFSGVLNKLLPNQSSFFNKLGHLENEIKELKVIKKDGVDPAPDHEGLKGSESVLKPDYITTLQQSLDKVRTTIDSITSENKKKS